MKPEHWRQLDQLLEVTLELPIEQRAAFLAEACAGDETLRQEVESLLRAKEQADHFMEMPAVGLAAEVLRNKQVRSLLGQSLGHYQILSQLGAGGMGEVYLADDTRLHRRVALKLLPAKFAADQDAERRLLREARAAATLDHPNICTIHEIGENNGHRFIVMQYVEGETLADWLKRAQLSIAESLSLATQIADALDEAHTHQIIHRDIKPANIIVTPRGQAKVLDFGLAKFMPNEQPLDSKTETASLLSTPGLIVGTVPYMSPEQVRGERLDARTDIFSFGVVLYEMVSGRHPFAGTSQAEVIAAILTKEPPPPGGEGRKLPETLAQLIRKAMAKDRAQRYQTMRELMVDLDRCRQAGASNPTTAPALPVSDAVSTNASVPQPAPRSRRVWWGLALLGLVVTLAFAYVLFWRRTTTISPEIKSLVVLPLKNQSGNAQDDFLSDGITDELITKLTKLKTVRVVSHSIATRFKNSTQDAAAIGRELAVEAVLDGTMRRSGSRFRLSVHLVNAQDGFELWADDDFEISLSDVLDAQRHLAEAVAAKLKRQLTAQDRALVAKDNTTNAQAYELLLRGKERFSKGEFDLARQLFQQAIQLDPNFADAYAWLSLGLNEKFHHGKGNRATLDEAIVQANKALALDPNLSMARRALITVYRNISQTEEGLKQAKLVLATNPDDFDAIVAAALAYWETGMIDRAIQLYQKALALDPSAADVRRPLARCYLYTGEYQKGLDVLAPLPAQQREGWLGMVMQLYGRLRQFDRAIEIGQRVIEREDGGASGFLVYLTFGEILKRAGRTSEARAAWREGVRRGEAQLAMIENVRNRIWLGDLYARLEAREQALAQVKRANTIEPNNAWVLHFSGVINARLGNKREAVAYLKQAVAQGFREIQYFQELEDQLGDDPAYRAVRDDLQKRVEELRRQY